MAAAFRSAVRGAEPAADGRRAESVPALVDVTNPYKGLHAFQESDADDFFGREALVQQLVNRLGAGADDGDGRFLDSHGTRFMALVGPSGSGKSSAVKAGLIPALRGGALPGSDKWFVTEMVPGTNPMEELELALWRVAVDPPPDLIAPMERDTRGILRTLRRILPAEPAPRDGDPQLLLIVDQFEELFTLVEDDARRAFFLDSLLQAMEAPRSPLRVVVTLRADFYDRPLQHPEWGQLLKEYGEIVLPLNRTELAWAVREPAARMGVRLEEGLAGAIVADVADQPGSLPLLQYAMTELFERREGNLISRAAYEDLGGVQGALVRRAEAVYADLDDVGREAARQLFLRLVALGEGVEDTRRRVPRSELEALAGADGEAPMREAPMVPVLDRFGAARFLTFDRDPLTRAPTVEVAHEALLREWPRLRRWLAESRDDVRLQRLLARAAKEWSAAGEDPSFLLRGGRLEQFEGWAHATELALTLDERNYLQASLDLRRAEERDEAERQAREARLKQRARTVLRVLVAVFALAAVVAGGLAIVANSQRLRAEASEQEALRQASIGLAAQAMAELDSDSPERAVLLAVEALEKYPYTPQAEKALAQTVYATIPYREFSGALATTRATAFSPDGTYIVSVSAEYDAVIWDVATGKDNVVGKAYPMSDERRAYIDVDWSPDGSQFVVVAGANGGAVLEAGTIKIWRLPGEENIATWSGHNGQDVNAVDWSGDGDLVATGGGDNLARVWRAGSWEEIGRFAGHTDTVRDVAISPEGGHLATAGADMTIRIWDMASGEELEVLSGHLGAVNAVDWSPDGSRLISAGDDGIAIIWDVPSGEIRQTVMGHSAAVRHADWSPDGALVATASADGTARVWDIATNSTLATILGTSRGLSWSPDGTHLVVGVGQGTLRMWRIPRQALQLVGHEAGLIVGKWTPDGSRIVTTAFDGTARVWDALSGELELTFTNHQLAENPVVAEIAISPDSQWVATSGTDNHVRVWNVESGRERLTFSDMSGAREFSPDGTRLAIIDDERALILDMETDTILHDFSPGYGSGGCFRLRMAWSPDGRYFVVPCFLHPQTSVWDARTGERVTTLSHVSQVHASSWTDDGNGILTADSSGHLNFWDAESGKLLHPITADTSVAWDVEISPDGSRAATGGGSGQVRIWDIETRQEVNSFNVGFSILNVHWSPEGNRMLATGIRPIPDIRPVWQSTEELIAYAYDCCVFRELTAEEREQFGLEPTEDDAVSSAP